MKSILTKIQVLSYLCALPALANDVGLHNSSAQPTRAGQATPIVIVRTIEQQTSQQKFDYLIKTCKEIPSDPLFENSAERDFFTTDTLNRHGLQEKGHLMSLGGYIRTTKPYLQQTQTLIQAPKHDTLTANDAYDQVLSKTYSGIDMIWKYSPAAQNYNGNDSAVFAVESEGKRSQSMAQSMGSASVDWAELL